jgi:hypothetical protein
MVRCGRARDSVEETLAEHETAIRRLCVAADAGAPGLLTCVQRTEGFYRLYLMSDPANGAEMAFASPGLDEVSLVADLIAAMRHEVVATQGLRLPVLAGFHVGMTKVVGDGFGGAGADRTRALIADPTIRATLAHASPPVMLAVAVTAVLFEELHAEGQSDHGWQRIPAANAWLRLFDPRVAELLPGRSARQRRRSSLTGRPDTGWRCRPGTPEAGPGTSG